MLRGPDGALLAEGKPTAFQLALPQPVSFAEAEAARANYIGFREHPYPGCFVCGPARAPDFGAGLGLFPGAVSGQQLVAAPWQPARDLCDEHGLARKEFVWAALDCPSWFGHAAFVERVPKILLGRLAVAVLRLPRGWRALRGAGLGARSGRPSHLLRVGTVWRGRGMSCLRTRHLDGTQEPPEPDAYASGFR